MKFEIRPARLEDAANLTALTLRSKQSNGYDDAFMAACRDELTITAHALSSDNYWVAHQGDVLCGYASLIIDGQTLVGKVDDFFIDPDWQRQGIGQLLWDKILTLAKGNQLIKLYLDADPFAVPFYEAMGFVIVGEVPSGSIKGRMLPRMEIRLIESLHHLEL